MILCDFYLLFPDTTFQCAIFKGAKGDQGEKQPLATVNVKGPSKNYPKLRPIDIGQYPSKSNSKQFTDLKTICMTLT